MTATDKRAALMVVANDLQMELARLRAAVAEVVRPVSEKIAALVGAADALLVASADEITSGEVRKVRKVRTKPGGEIEVDGLQHGESPIERAAEILEHVEQQAKFDRLRTRVMAPGKRACSLCHQPGHRKQNCPNAHIMQERKRHDVATRVAMKTKRKMKPLSEARKAQLREQLKAARAARGKS